MALAHKIVLEFVCFLGKSDTNPPRSHEQGRTRTSFGPTRRPDHPELTEFWTDFAVTSLSQENLALDEL